MKNPLLFVAGRGTSFEVVGPDVFIGRDETPLIKIPFVDLLEFSKQHPLQVRSAIAFES